MGYELNIKLKGELDSQFTSYLKKDNSEEIEDFKNYILVFVVNCPKTTDAASIMKADKELKWIYRLLVESLVQNWKFSHSSEDKDYHYCDNYDYEIETSMKSIYRELLLYATTKEFSIDSDTYWDDVQAVLDSIALIEECVYDMWNRKFIDFYKNNAELAEIEESW